MNKSSAIVKLEPFMNSSGILCIGGRLQHAPLSDQSKHQIILPRKHHVSKLIVRQYHEVHGHCGREYIFSQIRQKFWILGARRLIKQIIRDCVHCRRRTGPLGYQRMSDLPVDRVTPGKAPFSHVGVDCFGPFLVKRGRSEIKRYGCLFTCCTLRAIHIEKLDTMETETFINAFKRFECRRGRPELVRSDNGTNFVGGDREIRQAIRLWNQDMIAEHMRQREIEWLFNPPSASHMGGFWERQIRTVRKVLNSLQDMRLTDDESLETLFCEVEAIVNNRPITVVSCDSADPEPLTPNHLLLLRTGVQLPLGIFDIAETYRKRWKHVQHLADVFWKRWIVEYLPSLQLRQKWIKPSRNFAVDDIVLIRDENTFRGNWPLGRICKVFPGKDGLVRSVEVKTKSTVLTRPIHKLCLLESAV